MDSRLEVQGSNLNVYLRDSCEEGKDWLLCRVIKCSSPESAERERIELKAGKPGKYSINPYKG